jgi:antitoxin (DNA-binding transcriptional repressor) of toxin-antitoxin stability system
MVAEHLSEADLASSLTEVLDRVRRGERFAVERNREIIAEISPLREKSGMTLRELAVELARLPRLDDDFAADIEAARMILLPADLPEWPD